MAAPLETLDQIRDALINRGIGSSGLAQQAIQRANLSDLSTSLATARSIQAEQQRRKQFELQSLAAGKQIQTQQQRLEKRTPFLRVGVGANQQPFISGGEGISGTFVTSGSPAQFAQDITNILKGTGGGVKLNELSGDPTLDNLLLELRAKLNVAGAKVI